MCLYGFVASTEVSSSYNATPTVMIPKKISIHRYVALSSANTDIEITWTSFQLSPKNSVGLGWIGFSPMWRPKPLCLGFSLHILCTCSTFVTAKSEIEWPS